MKGGFDRDKSLQDLEQDDWGESTFDSNLIRTCHRLRRKPLDEFTIGDLRIMIGQQISLSYLVPLAVERLEEEPLAEGNFFPGDLLAALLGADEGFWNRHPDSLQRIRQVIRRVRELLSSLDEEEFSCVRKALDEAPRFLVD